MRYDVLEKVLITGVLVTGDRTPIWPVEIMLAKPIQSTLSIGVQTVGEAIIDGVADWVENLWPFGRRQPKQFTGQVVQFRGRVEPPKVQIVAPLSSPALKFLDERFGVAVDLSDHIEPKFDIEVTYPHETLLLRGAQVTFIDRWHPNRRCAELICDYLKPL